MSDQLKNEGFTKPCFCGNPHRKGWGHTSFACGGPSEPVPSEDAREFIRQKLNLGARILDATLTENELVKLLDSFAAHVDSRAAQDVEKSLRFEWWRSHGKCAGMPYGDDGEMQCCNIDFKRMPLDELRELIDKLRSDYVAERVAAQPDTRKEKLVEELSQEFNRKFYARHDHKYSGLEILRWLQGPDVERILLDGGKQ